jgi:2-polyprenyl-6-methoxyphenol hydroxylase-like FAD-dependent oxidoreductase
MIHNIPQPDFEQFVADQLAEDPQVEIRKGVSFISCVQKGDEVISTVEERATKNRYQIRSRNVVGCDGARSAVRNHFGIESEGEQSCNYSLVSLHWSEF